MTRPDLSTTEAVNAYRAELRAAARKPRLAGFGLVVLGVILVWLSPQGGAGVGPAVQWAGYASLAGGWALMIYAIFARTRHHRRRMAELDGDAA